MNLWTVEKGIAFSLVQLGISGELFIHRLKSIKILKIFHFCRVCMRTILQITCSFTSQIFKFKNQDEFFKANRTSAYGSICTVGHPYCQMKHPYLFQQKLPYRNETGTHHHGLVSTSVWCFKIFLWGASTWGFST